MSGFRISFLQSMTEMTPCPLSSCSISVMVRAGSPKNLSAPCVSRETRALVIAAIEAGAICPYSAASSFLCSLT